MKHSQEHSEFILLNIPPYPYQKHKNNMSRSLHTWIMTMDLTFLFMLSSPWFPNYQGVEPNLKTLWYHFSLVKKKLFHNSTSELFRSEVKFSCWKIKQDKSTSQENICQTLTLYSHIILWFLIVEFPLVHIIKFRIYVQCGVLLTILDIPVFTNISPSTTFHVHQCEILFP